MPRSFPAAACLAPLLAVGLSAHAADDPVVVEATASEPGGPVSAVVRSAGAPVHVPSCRGVTWEAYDDKSHQYVPLSVSPCGPAAPAVKIDKDGTEFELDGDPGTVRAVRPVVVVGEGCTDGVPFALARCRSLSVVEGRPLYLRAPAED